MGLRWLLGAILLVAAVLRLWSIDFGFPGRYRPDEGYIVLKAFRVLQGQFDPNFFVYPSLYIYVIAFVFFIIQTMGDFLGIFGRSSAPVEDTTRFSSISTPGIEEGSEPEATMMFLA